MAPDSTREKATFAGGCFWCIEAVFNRLQGVESVVPGYCGGETDDPTYEEVCTGTTGHAEVIRITFDPDVIRFEELLEVFFSVHNPTTRDREGPDVGSQYRSAVFYHTEDQRDLTERVIERLEGSGAYEDAIVTEVEPASEFYEAEEYHHEYYEKNSRAPYCVVNITPKIEKLESEFQGKVKP